MSGTIVFSGESWHSSGRVFRILIDGIVEKLGDGESSLAVKHQLHVAIAGGTNYVFVNKWFDDEMIVAFFKSFEASFDYFKKSGQHVLQQETKFESFMNLLEKLRCCFEKELSARNIPLPGPKD